MPHSKVLSAFAFSALLLPCLLTAKDRNWITGKLTDSKTVETGAKAVDSFAGGALKTTVTAELQIVAPDYTYTARSNGTTGILARPCRYIVGDPIKYVQEKSVLYLLDADGKECRATIVRQERTPPPPVAKH